MFDDLPYSFNGLDRVSRRRRDPAWIAAQRESDRAAILCVRGDTALFAAPGSPGAGAAPALVQHADAAQVFREARHHALLGVDPEGRPWFAADLSGWSEDDALALAPGGRLADLRRMSATLDRTSAGLLAFARGLMYWHRRHRFCGVCGTATEDSEAGFLRTCTNPDCAALHFPRTDPAVIMLVTRPGPDGGACLLGRQQRWPRGMYSTLAGFVEPGESLESAVAREVAEEAGILVDDVRYRASQPWPFPSSLMLGFRAKAALDSPIRMDSDELEDVGWFTRSELAEFKSRGRRLPHRDSIARRLVEEWLTETG